MGRAGSPDRLFGLVSIQCHSRADGILFQHVASKRYNGPNNEEQMSLDVTIPFGNGELHAPFLVDQVTRDGNLTVSAQDRGMNELEITVLERAAPTEPDYLPARVKYNGEDLKIPGLACFAISAG